MNTHREVWIVGALAYAAALGCAAAQDVRPAPVGNFEAHGDVGMTPKAGSIGYDSATGDYRVTGGGDNIWGTADAFQFAWSRVSGDVTLSADVRFLGKGAVDHRKAVLMVRQNLNADSAYADVALHGDGLTSLQFRTGTAAETKEVRAEENAPLRLRLVRRGNQFTMYLGAPGGELKSAGSAAVALDDPVYVGIGVCSHDAGVLETAVFSNVRIEALPRQARERSRYRSKISIYDLDSKSVRAVYTADTVFEAPGWSLDGQYLLANSNGTLYRIPVNSAGAPAPEKVDVAPGYDCNNDKGYSPDGKLLAISAQTASLKGSRVYLVSPDSASPKLMTPNAPSYFHGWSPDGGWLAFVGQRAGNWDLYRVSVTGGPEQRLTSNRGYDDGPDYSPDGKWIYFNSDRSGGGDIWRMPADGAGPDDSKAEQITRDEWEDWFPHPSPDGKWMVFLSFPKGTRGHDERLDGVEIRMMRLPGAKVEPAPIQVLTKFFGGQGTMNINSWSPNSKQFAFVVYEPFPAQ